MPTAAPPAEPSTFSRGARSDLWSSYDARDLIALLWRERMTVATVFAAVAALGLLIAFGMRTMYPARSSLLIRLSSEYVYNPRVGDAARGAVPEIDQVIQSETEILGSAVVKARVIRDIGLPRLFPKLGAAWVHASSDRRRTIEGAAIKTIEQHLKITTAPGTSVVRLTYAHDNPQMSALVLNTLVDEYLNYRNEVLGAHDAGVIGDERRAFQSRLDAADAAYEKFLADNGIGDFETEKTSLAQIYSQLLTDSYNVQAQLGEAEGRLGVTDREVSQSQPEIGLYRDVDHALSDKLLQLRMDRQDLLSRYKAGAQPVQDVDRKIAELESLSATGAASAAGAKRVGVNPVYQTLETERDQLRAEAASLKNRRAVLAGEIAQVEARRKRLAELEPTYEDLVRQRDVLSGNVKSFTAREQESQAQQAIAQKGDDNVRVVERAFVPTTGSSLKKPLFLASLLFAAFAGVCAGLLRGFRAAGYPTPRSAARTLSMPVLATARFRTAEA
jgi:uncharacterized protein involved in exopolysaccharide biosynthesis